MLNRFRLSAGGAGKSAPKHECHFQAILGKISIAMLLQMVRARNLRVNDVVELYGCYEMAGKIWRKGSAGGCRPHRKKTAKYAILPFCPIFRPACSPDLLECWQTVYSVLYYVQCAVRVPSLAPLALRVGEMWTPQH